MEWSEGVFHRAGDRCRSTDEFQCIPSCIEIVSRNEWIHGGRRVLQLLQVRYHSVGSALASAIKWSPLEPITAASATYASWKWITTASKLNPSSCTVDGSTTALEPAIRSTSFCICCTSIWAKCLRASSGSVGFTCFVPISPYNHGMHFRSRNTPHSSIQRICIPSTAFCRIGCSRVSVSPCSMTSSSLYSFCASRFCSRFCSPSLPSSCSLTRSTPSATTWRMWSIWRSITWKRSRFGMDGQLRLERFLWLPD